MANRRIITALSAVLFIGILFLPSRLGAEPLPFPTNVNIDIGTATEPEQVVGSLQLLMLLTVLTLVPAFLALMTSFTRIVVVLGFVRNALATQQTPPNQVIIGLALFLTFFIMAPIYTQVNETAIQPYLEEEITQEEALAIGAQPLREFMFHQTREKDLALFVNISNGERPETRDDVPMHVLVPAFVISELKTAFQMGFMLFIPFVIIDMVVASTLMSMGMFMLPPVMVSLPFKLLLFVMVDGWHLVVKSLVESFG
ncbi:flagellar type III secretion system pore protein FliP [Dethiobacter alkaliphilus]|nr:flagellar type III secretion system pore protein FliP [Dethiobacter alkaliphilus]MCW3488734.1 flagellar type III secretion system pore protein FliP [Dethiobacter alkaliphilus]